MGRPSRGVRQSQYLLASPQALGGARGLAEDLEIIPNRAQRAGTDPLERMLHGRHVRPCKKRGLHVGKTRKGKGTKLMVLADGQGIPLGVSLHSASPGETQLAPETLATVRVGRRARGRPRQNPDRLICDRGYDSLPFRRWLHKRGIELIAPHLSTRRRIHQDGRPLRRYRRRWKIERTIAWLGNFRRVGVRWDRYITIYRAFVHLACLLITSRRL